LKIKYNKTGHLGIHWPDKITNRVMEANWSGARTNPAKKKKMELALTYTEKK